MIARDIMDIAIAEAKIAFQQGEVPVGAVIVHNNKIIARTHNKIIVNKDPLAHAEILAINYAVQHLDILQLTECDMFVTLEPCAMCAGAIVLSRIRRVYIGTDDEKTGAGGSIYNILQDKRLNHYCEVYHNIHKDACSQLLYDFFTELRKNKKNKYD